jgi:hypothetical protein
MISSPGGTSVVHAETFLTVDGLSISYFEDEPGRQSAAKLLSKDEARRIVFSSLVVSGEHWSLQTVLVCERRLTRMLVGPCRDFTCPHCGASYKLGFVVRDHDGLQLACVYFEDEPGRQSAAKLLTEDETRPIYGLQTPPCMV